MDKLEFLFNNYRFEESRLLSYKYWPSTSITPVKLVAAGFFYTGEADRVKCFECGIEISQWIEGDNPMSEHQRWRSSCKFVRGEECGNVPVDSDPSILLKIPPRRRRQYGEIYEPNACPDFRCGQQNSSRPVHCGDAEYPQYTEYEDRLKTFDKWPQSMPQKKEQLADAGFYYTGRGDETQCFQCGGGLKYWEPQDDPWEQHAKWFTKCAHVKINYKKFNLNQ